MITIAIAGGTSPGIGRAIVTAIQKYPTQLKPIIISRSASPTPAWLQNTDIEVRKVEYTSEDLLFKALQGVHTLLCTLLAQDGTSLRTHTALLTAGLRAGISRFVPAEFGSGLSSLSHISMFAPLLEIHAACQNAKHSNPNFEWTAFRLGLFMNYLGYGAADEVTALNGLQDSWVPYWDVKNMVAKLPLRKDGGVPRISLMEIGDVGRYVAVACLLPAGEWREDFGMVGQTVRMDEVVRIVEEVRGRKMRVEWRRYEDVVREMEGEKVVYPNKFWGQIEEMVARDEVGEGVMEPVLNGILKEVERPMSVEKYVRKFWA
ncbi:NAD(P)-binding protein [Amniculicola lignicola CBS 123094]|uniref:NAD(P)-binding protein n=1 Tax=Amniculicola lignicola CBS 123094 TaxID=1392246 RepID=A0A6A5X2K6_9PLEO|nr:NAD(P)-binding protein [Amniculicola lignicola CBS 123094]